jgi:predicted RNA-binding protein (virulence factor B family)
MALLGKRNLLTIVRGAPPGFYLDGGSHGEILLPGRYIPPGATPGGKIDVFVYRDSEDRLVATTQKALASVGEFAGLKVVSTNPRIGVFLAWGLDKDLLLPIREMSGPLNPGDTVVVQVALDPQSDRVFASARLNRRLELTPLDTYHAGDAVKLLVMSESPLGYNMIVNDAHRGLLYHSDVPTPLKVGQQVEGYVRSIRPDGKLDLATGRAGYRRIGSLTEQIIAALEAAGGRLPYHDNSPPDDIRAGLGMSKKAFKQAIGALFREQRIFIDPDGIRLMKTEIRQP